MPARRYRKVWDWMDAKHVGFLVQQQKYTNEKTGEAFWRGVVCMARVLPPTGTGKPQQLRYAIMFDPHALGPSEWRKAIADLLRKLRRHLRQRRPL